MGWALINFSCLWDGRLFEVGANSRLGAYSNKYGISVCSLLRPLSEKNISHVRMSNMWCSRISHNV